MQKQPVTLDLVVVLAELEEVRKAVEEQRKTIEALKERINKLEADADVTEAGFHIVANALELHGILVACEAAKPVKPEPIAAVSETTFTILKFEKQQGARIGEFEMASKEQNLPEKWNPGYNILRQSNAIINARYHGEEYQFSYWLWHEKLQAKIEAES
jgi:hypothetical protein